MDAAQFGEYLHLIGFKPTRCDLTALKTLLTRHMAALPFQTLSTVLGEPVPIDSGSIFRKLVVQRRGGYCYELNLLLLDALTTHPQLFNRPVASSDSGVRIGRPAERVLELLEDEK